MTTSLNLFEKYLGNNLLNNSDLIPNGEAPALFLVVFPTGKIPTFLTKNKAESSLSNRERISSFNPNNFGENYNCDEGYFKRMTFDMIMRRLSFLIILFRISSIVGIAVINPPLPTEK